MDISSLHRYLKKRNFTALVVLGTAIYALCVLIILLSTPGDSAGIYLGEHVVVKQASLDQQLQPGDVILKIGSLEVGDRLLQPGYGRAVLFFETSRWVRYTVVRDNQVLQVRVPWDILAFNALITRAGTLLIVGLLCLGLAVLILARSRVEESVKHLLTLDLTFLALNQINNILPASSANVCLAWSWLFIPIDLLSIWLFSSFALHSLLVFPEIKWPMLRFPKRCWLLHLVVPFLSILSGFIWGDGTLLGFRNTLFAAANPLMIVEIGLGLFALTHTYFKPHQAGVRNQIRWLIWGIVVATVPWLFLYVLPSLLYGDPWLPLSLTNITVGLLPITFAIAIFRYGLMEIDRIINRTLVYILLTGVLVLIYLFVISVSRNALQQRTGLPNDFIAGIIAAAVIFLLFNPLRIYAQRLIDRVFYREQFDFPLVIGEISQELSSTILLDDMVALLMQEVPKRLGLTGAQVMLLDERQRFYRTWRSVTALRIPVESPLVLYLKDKQVPLILHQLERLPVAVQQSAQFLVDQRTEICLPLIHHNTLIGLYLLGSRLSGNLINRQQFETLTLLGRQAAAALQNAQLYLALKDYSQHLENRVAVRTSELMGERDRLDTILRNIADGLVVTDMHGKIVLVNPVFSRIVQKLDYDIVGLGLCTIFPAEGLREIILQAVESPGEVFTDNLVEVLPADAGTAPRIYKASACAFLQRYTPLPGRPETMSSGASGVVTVLRDITHEMAVDRMKTDFISTVSHELRTPLTSVLGFTKLISRLFARDIVPQLVLDDRKTQRAVQHITSNLEIIVSEGNRLTRLINDVLDIAKMESGKYEWNMTWINIEDVIERSVSATALLAQEKGLALRTKLSTRLPSVYADRDRLIQVVTNLLSNAIKFTDSGYVEVHAVEVHAVEMNVSEGQENIRNLGVHVPTLEPGNWLVVSVKDTGIGIAEGNLPRVFERFEQLGDALTDHPKGTGLGLPICKEIVARHGGPIWVESSPGVGSIFIFALPLRAKGVEQPESAVSSDSRTADNNILIADARGRLILVVDDEANICSLLDQELTDVGYQVTTVTSGEEALQHVHLNLPDLIILDVRMPDLDGFAVLKILRATPVTASVPVILLSISEDGERGLLLGADAYQTKPIDMVRLIDTMDRLLIQAACDPAPEVDRE